MRVIDLFSGMGGLSLGFKQAGFEVVGYEQNTHALATYRHNLGTARDSDLAADLPHDRAECVIGGPPCRPWSPINLHRRRAEHDDYALVRAFDKIVLSIRPRVFVMENVPFLRGDPTYQALIGALAQSYEIRERIIRYADWGAASKRRRLFIVGVRSDDTLDIERVLSAVDSARVEPQTVRDAIERYKTDTGVMDHEWANFKTIEKYRDKYDSGQYGWYQLHWDESAPSFGNVAKTYTLHPDGAIGNGARVLSPREVMALLGFPDTFVFPASVPLSAKYRMVADAVSPLFGRALASAIRTEFERGPG